MSFRKISDIRQHSWAAVIIGGASIAYGAYSKGRANKKAKDAQSKRKAYKTPDEIFDILNATQNKAQGDTATRDFQQNQLDTSFGQALGTASFLGADPNSLSSLFGQKIQGQLQIGNQFHASNMQLFGNYLNALNTVADNKAAEQVSSDNMLKDLLQAAAADKAAANQTINSGINGVVGGISAYGTGQLYGNSTDRIGDKYGTGAQNYADSNGLNYNQYKKKANAVGDAVSGLRF